MDIRAVRIHLLQKGYRLKDIARLTGISYDRVVKLLNAYRQARPEEIKAIARALGIPESSIATGDAGPRHDCR